jgi:hypothetical protein
VLAAADEGSYVAVFGCRICHPEIEAEGLARLLHRSVTRFADTNATPAADERVGSPTDNFDLNYGGAPIPNRMMGRGVIDAAAAVRNALDEYSSARRGAHAIRAR